LPTTFIWRKDPFVCW